MQFSQNPPDSQNPKNPQSHNEIPPQFTLEYYKHKQNGIERNLDDLLRSLLPRLVTMDATRYAAAAKAYSQPHHPAYDALDIKSSLQSAYRTDPTEIDDYEAYKKAASEMYFDDGQEKLLSNLNNEELAHHIEEQDKKVREALNYYKKIEAGEVTGLELKSMGGIRGIATKQDLSSELRVNIKIDPRDSGYVIIKDLVQSFIQNPTVVKNGFRLKTLTGDTGTRDGVIIYIRENNFTDTAKTVTGYFKDDYRYHDRHADSGIMFGTALEAEDGSKFPGIRVTSEPKDPFSTYNEMQAALVSRATITYINKYFSGDKDKFIQAFRDNYSEAYLHFEQHFPKCYTYACKIVFGNDVLLSNLAFLGR